MVFVSRLMQFELKCIVQKILADYYIKPMYIVRPSEKNTYFGRFGQQ
jgi:hypothetical protein